MSQVGHADSKMTMDVYAQLQQGAKRDHGAQFDKLVRDARAHLQTTHKRRREPFIGTANGTEGRKRGSTRARRGRDTSTKPRDLQAVPEWAILDSNQGPLPYQGGRGAAAGRSESLMNADDSRSGGGLRESAAYPHFAGDFRR
jgi:hypothetical protein